MHYLTTLDRQSLVTANQKISDIIKSNNCNKTSLSVEQQEAITKNLNVIYGMFCNLMVTKKCTLKQAKITIGECGRLLKHIMASALNNKELPLDAIESSFNRASDVAIDLNLAETFDQMELCSSESIDSVPVGLSSNKRKQEDFLENGCVTKKSKVESVLSAQIQKINNDHVALTSLGLSFESMKAYLTQHGAKLKFLGFEKLLPEQALELMALCPNLEHLSMQRCRLDDEAVDKIVAQNYKLVSLNLSFNSIGNKGAETIATHFQATLQVLDLSANGIGDEGAAAIAKGLKLQRLDLSSTKISNEGVKVLAENLKETLRVLYLQNLEINTVAILAIAENLKSLQQFKLIASNVGDEGAEAIAKGLKFLQVLKLIDAGISSKGIKALTEGLPWLRKLNLNQNSVDDNGVEIIAEHSKFLHELRLQWNSVSVRGIEAIAKGLLLLKELNLSSDAEDINIRAIATRLPFVEVLKLRDCEISSLNACRLVHNLKFLQLLALDYDGDGISKKFKQCKIYADWDKLWNTQPVD